MQTGTQPSVNGDLSFNVGRVSGKTMADLDIGNKMRFLGDRFT